MSDKSHDAEPESVDATSGDPEAPEEIVEPGQEADPGEADQVDKTITELEKDFSDEEKAEAATIVRKTAKAPVKKGHATRKQSDALEDEEDPYKAKNPAHFVRQSAGELKQVVWPTWPQTVSMFTAVLIFVLIMIAVVGVLDFAFGWSLLKLLGAN